MSQIHSRYADSKGSQNANLLLTNLYLLLAASGSQTIAMTVRLSFLI